MKMKMSRKLLVVIMGIMMVFAMTACGAKAEPEDDGQTNDPLAEVNIEENGDVVFWCTVNGDWLSDNDKGNTTSRHFIIDSDGFNTGKSILTSYAKASDIYAKLVEAGFAVGERDDEVFTLEKGEKLTEGEAINVTLTWEGQEDGIALKDAVVMSDGSRPNIDIHFHGNKANFEKNYSGCVCCLDSCYVGITSNGAYGFLDVENNAPSILGDASVLPADGEVVMVRFSYK